MDKVKEIREFTENGLAEHAQVAELEDILGTPTSLQALRNSQYLLNSLDEVEAYYHQLANEAQVVYAKNAKRIRLAEAVCDAVGLFKDCIVSDKTTMEKTEDALYKAFTAWKGGRT